MYQVGLLGCGGYGDSRPTAPYSSRMRQAQAWGLHPKASLYAIADPDEGLLRQVGDDLDISPPRRYRSYEEMIEKERLDIVVLTAHPNRHAELVIPVLEAGINVVVDKPMSIDLEAADAMVRAAEDNGARLAVLHQGRVGPRQREMHRRIENGDIGRVVDIRAAGKGYYGGYDLFNASPHSLNSLRGFVKAEFDWVSGILESGERPTGPQDIVPGPNGFDLIAGQHLRIQLRFKDGTLASLLHLHHDPPSSDNVYLVVRGSEGGLCETYDRLFVTADVHPRPDSSWEELILPPAKTRIEGIDVDEPPADLWFADEMIKALDEGREHTCSAREALAGMEAMMGCLGSHFSANGGRVALPLQERLHPLKKARQEAGLGPPPEMPDEYYSWVEAEMARMVAAGLEPYTL